MSAHDQAYPAAEWRESARLAEPNSETQLRLAAIAGHLQVDPVAARRAAVIDLLADSGTHDREEICQHVAQRLGYECWGKRPQEALARDLAVLRKGGIRIGYSRRPGINGYYLRYPALEREQGASFGAINWELIGRLRALPAPEKNRLAWEAAELALLQKRLFLEQEHPDWPAERALLEARQAVYGVSPDDLP